MRQNDLFNRLKRTLGVFSTPASRSDRPVDPLVKLNLPPLMGRRDAAEDRIRSIMSQDIFSWPDEVRLNHYRNIGSLLDSILVDTRFILSMLSSPDTESREKRLLSYFEALREMARTLEKLCHMQINIFHKAGQGSGLADISPGNSDEQTINESEICLTNIFRDYAETAAPKLDRYRAYAAKSFSPQNLERYNKSYREYSLLFSSVGE